MCADLYQSMYRYGNPRNLITWVGSRVWFTLSSRAPQSLSMNKLAAEQARRAASGMLVVVGGGGR
jgi:hypothetical protein